MAMKTRQVQTGAGAGKKVVPTTGIIPPRPKNFRYDSATNQLFWDSIPTAKASKFHVQWAENPTDSDVRTSALWSTVSGSPVTNAGNDNALLLTDQSSDRWFRVYAESATLGLFGKIAGPIQNNRPATICVVKAYHLNLNRLDDESKLPGRGVRIEAEIDTSDAVLILAGHQHYPVKKLEKTAEEVTGFWEQFLLAGRDYKFTVFYDNVEISTSVRTVPSQEEIFYDDMTIVS